MTNALQTIINNSQTDTNIWPTNRKRQMIWLAALTAITLIGQYVLLGLTGLGESRSTLPSWFTSFELVLWGMRGLVEIAVVVYVGMTKGETNNQARALWGFKIVLIAMIVFTVGPIWGASALNTTVVDIMGRAGVILWGLGLAGISAMMLAAVAYAYKTQPVDNGYFILPLADYERMLTIVSQAEVTATEARAIADTMRGERDRAVYELEGMRGATGVFRFLPASAQIQIIALFANGLPPADKLAEEFGLSASTVRGVLARVSGGE